MASPARRRSVFHETGLFDDTPPLLSPAPKKERPQSVRFRSRDEVHHYSEHDDGEEVSGRIHRAQQSVESSSRATGAHHSPLPHGLSSMMYRFGGGLVLLAAVVSFLQSTTLFSRPGLGPLPVVEGGVIPEEARTRTEVDLSKRDDSPTDICFRWAQQSAIVNGTLYLYGGEASTQEGQTSNTWNNDFLTLDLTKTWQIGSPALTGLPQPSGPPAVALGYLWNSHESLYLYGGEFSSDPPTDPAPYATWEYSIASQSWIEHSNPVTSNGNSADSDNQPVQRAAEGAGVTVPQLGRGFYFGGHLDGYTTPDWSQSIWREYLESLLEFTFPGYGNSQVDSLGGGQTAGSDGVYRNITSAGMQSDAGFTKRADGLLIYVPGFGAQGILIALAGGTNTTFTQMNEVNVYDIATSSWYTQSTSGSTPNIRVNPCAVVAAAPDGSSYNIYMFGGQNLIPAGNQSQYNDMWILSLPSFTWIEVDQSDQSVPYGRSGATCNVWDAQMLMVGGYVGDQLSCESPGIYVYDLSNLNWAQQFTSLSGSSGSSDSSGGSSNPFNQQPNQRVNGDDPGGLEGSYGYQVPAAVYSVIGGGKTGGATLTTPVATATAGPLATGKPITYTVTSSNGATTTETSTPGGSNSNGGTTSSSSDAGHSGPNIAAIVVGVVCGLLLILIAYLLFCLYVYRKQLALYKRHVEMSQRQARGEKLPAIPGLWASDSAKTSSDRTGAGGQAEAPQFLGTAGIGAGGGESASQTSGPGRSHAGASSSGARSGANGYQSIGRSSQDSDSQDLMAGVEPTFVGVMLNPRRSLRVINRD